MHQGVIYVKSNELMCLDVVDITELDRVDKVVYIIYCSPGNTKMLSSILNEFYIYKSIPKTIKTVYSFPEIISLMCLQYWASKYQQIQERRRFFKLTMNNMSNPTQPNKTKMFLLLVIAYGFIG
jgi:hypothetical protein